MGLTTAPVAALQAETRDPQLLSEAGRSRGVEILVVARGGAFERIRRLVTSEDLHGASLRWLRSERAIVGELLTRSPEASDVAVRCWVDLSEPHNAHLYFRDRDAQRFLVRDVPLPHGLDELGAESVGQVLELSILALLENTALGMTREETQELLVSRGHTEPALAEPARESTDPAGDVAGSATSPSFGAAGFYGARLYSSTGPLVHGPGAALSLTLFGVRNRTVFSAGVQYEFSESVRTDDVGVEWTTVALRGAVERAWQVKAGSPLLGARVGAGVDVTHIEPINGFRSSTLALTSPRVYSVFVLTAGTAVSVALTSRLSASLLGFVDLYPTRVHYDLEGQRQSVEIYVPWRVRPGLTLSLILR